MSYHFLLSEWELLGRVVHDLEDRGGYLVAIKS